MKRMPRSSPTRNPVTNAPASLPRHSKSSAGGGAFSAALERLPNHDTRQDRGEGHSRSYSKSSITASQAHRMPLRILPVAPGAPGQPIIRTRCPLKRHPGLSAPMRNASSQERLRPRNLRVIRSSLLASRLAAACRLRRSCHRHRGPVALPRSGCPVRRSRHPAARTAATHRPSPATPRHFAVAFRGYAAAHARKTPCQIQTTDIPNKQPRPHTPRLLDPAYPLRIKQQGVSFAHVRLLHTPGAFGPSRGQLWAFCRGARLARVVRLQKEGWGLQPHTPLFAREAWRRRNPPQSVSPVINGVYHLQCVCLSPGGRRLDPRCPLRFHRTRGLRRLDRTGVTARSVASRRPRGPAVVGPASAADQAHSPCRTRSGHDQVERSVAKQPSDRRVRRALSFLDV